MSVCGRKFHALSGHVYQCVRQKWHEGEHWDGAGIWAESDDTRTPNAWPGIWDGVPRERFVEIDARTRAPTGQPYDAPSAAGQLAQVVAGIHRLFAIEANVEPGPPTEATRPDGLAHWYDGQLSKWRWAPDEARERERLVLEAYHAERALVHAARLDRIERDLGA